jgi:hypothetical protein
VADARKVELIVPTDVTTNFGASASGIDHSDGQTQVPTRFSTGGTGQIKQTESALFDQSLNKLSLHHSSFEDGAGRRLSETLARVVGLR